MKTFITASVQFFKRKESLLFLIIILTGLNLFGWLSGKMGLTSFSMKFIPIPHSSAVVFIAISILYLLSKNFGKSGSIITSILLLMIAFYCSLIFLDFLFDFAYDVENIFIRNPEKFGKVFVDRMSPITSLLFILICFSGVFTGQKLGNIIKYFGGGFSLLVLLTSSVLLIGYLYKAPVLYGSQYIPVSLPTAISFFLFSITLLRIYEYKYWTFNLIKDNKVTRQLLKSFLPIVVSVVILQGFLISNYSFHKNNPTLSVAFILFIVVIITIFLVFRVAASIGNQLLGAEMALKESENQLKQLNVDKDRFISILSHDLINPFNNLLGLSDLLNEDIRELSRDEIEDMAKSINSSARNTFNLLEDILVWGRSQQGKIPFRPQSFSFSDICTYITDLFGTIASSKMITIKCHYPNNLNVFADFNMVKTIMRNLVSNALKFTNNGGTITIRADENKENVLISVSDNGVGIKAEDLSRLFDISQVYTTRGTDEEAGTGLGLLICKDFVEKHNGKIWVESSPEKGSDFRFSLPVFHD